MHVLLGDIRLAILCIAGLAGVASLLFLGALVLGPRLSRRQQSTLSRAEQRRYDEQFNRIVQGELDSWDATRETIPARDSVPPDVTPEVPQGLYDGLPEDQITDEER
jgi:hypothetical protein